MDTNRAPWKLNRLLAPILGALAVGAPAAAQLAPCGLDNRRDWCVDQNSVNGAGVAVTDAAESGDRFGEALAFGDFDGDGLGDLAIGAPFEEQVGAVHVFFGAIGDLGLLRQQFFSQNTIADGDGDAEEGDEFGAALAVGDFNGDGFDDLAIGSPGEDLPEDLPLDCPLFDCDEAGVVHVIPGGPDGLDLAAAEFFGNIPTFTREGSRTGEALVAGRFDVDEFDDLAVGTPGFPVGDEHGRVEILFGTPGGLITGASMQHIGLDPGDCDAAESGFGAALAAGNFDADGTDELLVGAPECAVSDADLAGAVFFFGDPTNDIRERLVQSDLGGADAPSDVFGFALATADFDGDGFQDLATAAPLKNHGAGNPSNSGRAYVALSDGGAPDPDEQDLIGQDEWAGETPEADDRLGVALAAGDFDADGFADLLIGAPGEGATDRGALYFKRGAASGLVIAGNRVISQAAMGGNDVADDRLGSVLAAGDIDGDGVLEIAVGVPAKVVDGVENAGRVYVSRVLDPRWIFADGFESTGTAMWSNDTP